MQNNQAQYPTRILPTITLISVLISFIGFCHLNGYKLFVIASGSMEPALSVGTLIVTQPYSRYYPRQVVTYYKSYTPKTIPSDERKTYSKSNRLTTNLAAEKNLTDTEPSHSYATDSSSAKISYKNNDILHQNSQSNPSHYAVTHRIVSSLVENDSVYYKTQGDANPHPDDSLVSHDQVVGRVWLALPLIGYLLIIPHYRIGFYLIIILPALLLIISHSYRIYLTFSGQEE